MNSYAPIKVTYFPQPPSLLVPPRMDSQELLDLGAGSIQDVKANFADLWRINRYLGGLRAVTQHLYPRLQRSKERQLVVDIGTGSADIPAAIGRWASNRQIDLRLWGLDLSARHLALAQREYSPEQPAGFIQADALHIPFKAASVDYFISCLFLHHLTPEQVITFLARTFSLARRGIIVSDIVRGRLPLIAFKLGQPVFARSFLTRHDGVVSIRRAYTPAELQQLAQMAGLPNARVYHHLPWRMTLVVDK
jgi:methyltransferase family protein